LHRYAKYNPLTWEVCRKTELGEGTDLQYRNDACVPFQENHMRNYKTVTSGKCKTEKCAALWRKFNGRVGTSQILLSHSLKASGSNP
jgi:hypothetical protein